jgi:putative FmdB family regulatory protein
MPLYEYCCVACGASEERLSSFSAPMETDCPSCGKPAGMRRQVSAPLINFSGGRWYAQGYSDTPPCQAGKAEGKDSAASPSKAPKEAGGACANCPAKTL